MVATLRGSGMTEDHAVIAAVTTIVLVCTAFFICVLLGVL